LDSVDRKIAKTIRAAARSFGKGEKWCNLRCHFAKRQKGKRQYVGKEKGSAQRSASAIVIVYYFVMSFYVRVYWFHQIVKLYNFIIHVSLSRDDVEEIGMTSHKIDIDQVYIRHVRQERFYIKHLQRYIHVHVSFEVFIST